MPCGCTTVELGALPSDSHLTPRADKRSDVRGSVTCRTLSYLILAACLTNLTSRQVSREASTLCHEAALAYAIHYTFYKTHIDIAAPWRLPIHRSKKVLRRCRWETWKPSGHTARCPSADSWISCRLNARVVKGVRILLTPNQNTPKMY